MGRRCCVTGCNSTSRLPEHHGVTYHSFPLDANIRAIWMRNTRLSSERPITKSVLVCSRHFRRIDFQPQRSGKYLLKQRVFPTVFPWGKVDPTQVESDLEDLKNNSMNTSSATNQSTEDATKATVEAKVAQIMAETAERSAAKANADNETASPITTPASASPAAIKFEPVTSFNPGARLEAQDFDGVWHAARVVEVDNDDREVLIKFERSGKVKSAVVGTEEWIPMNSTRLRQKVSTKPVPVFELEEKCMARWSGPRKFPGTIKKILGNDIYEVLFDDGYVKNVRAVHINKIQPLDTELQAPISSPTVPSTPQNTSTNMPETSPLKTPKNDSPLPVAPSSTSAKKRSSSGSRKDWPLLDLAKLDLCALNLPDIPRDGEWTCHWVNDQPIGKEGFLIVGEHRKPTVIVEDWRLPPGWVKHMYQRSNVLGKWDVILVTPGGKRFRSKADLKVFLEEQGQMYNPDIYDFSIHRRRAKDINAYVYTSDYTPQPPPKPKPLDNTIAAMDAASVKAATTALAISTTQYIETPVATAEPPAELMTPTLTTNSPSKDHTMDVVGNADNADAASGRSVDANLAAEDGYAYIGGLKVQIINNLFRCPQEGCLKNFRKEDHLQIHIKHYHPDLNKLLGSCPKMLDLAEKRTHTKPDQHEPAPRNQIPNQQFFAKLHQQDMLQTRAHRRSAGAHPTTTTTGSASQATVPVTDLKSETDNKMDTDADAETSQISVGLNETVLNSSAQDNSIVVEMPVAATPMVDDSLSDISGIPAKRSRMSPSKRTMGSRKSNRQRTTKRYLTAAQATAGTSLLPVVTGDNSFGVSDFEETRHSFNATPDVKVVEVGKKRKSSGAPVTSMSSLDSPVTADSGSSSFPPLLAHGSNEADAMGAATSVNPQYIKENGELIKIVSMRQEEIINCLCSYGEEDGLMIQCELCLCWQHGICNGIDKEVDVPEKYVCYICRNPQRGRESMRFKHDQDWLYDGKLPVANYHIGNPNLPKRFEFLKKSHVLTGNLVELNRFMHSLRVKMNIANNRCHPKLYLWAKKWEEDIAQQSIKTDIKSDQDIKIEDAEIGSKVLGTKLSPNKRIKSEPTTPSHPIPNIPQPEAPIDPVECQHRLMDHIKIQQNLVLKRLDDIENEIDELENQDELIDLKDGDYKSTKDVLASFIKELDVMKQLAKLNALENTKQTMKNAVTAK
ncbi:uncharacterized protein LOC105210226 [Zeugodacus cucurbitae]|uniref:PHD finger protein 20-like protein 1 n=1 Tax=Zeugodacus cucurbitae TaxID=28588 RepID=A0A0A1X9K2_ZEUCU|nr:uncharacterized protein LOC105210226 [Zeugodacus cucurbitae]